MSCSKLNVAVLFGGHSSEHEVSRNSAVNVLMGLDKEKYMVYKIGITEKGYWFLTEATGEEISNGSWEKRRDNISAVISPDRSVGGIMCEDGSKIAIDVVIPVLHGKNGEDGTMQGLLEIAGIPYVGPGVCASACSMDKTITKVLVEKTDVKQADYYTVYTEEFNREKEKTAAAVAGYFRGLMPLFVKPAEAGSSVGASKVKSEDRLIPALEKAAAEDDKILVEENINGREIEVAVIGNKEAKASPVGEILSGNDFYDYEAKYISNNSKTRVIDDLDPKKEKEIKDAAVTVYNAMGCRGLSRVDFFLKNDGQVIFNEINTLPGFTNISMYPKLWEAAGTNRQELLDQLMQLALDVSN